MNICIQSIFPEKTQDHDFFISTILKNINYHDWIGYGGFSDKKYLELSLRQRYLSSDLLKYSPLTAAQIENVENIISEVFHNCEKKLIPTHKPVYFFVHPFFSDSNSLNLFKGVLGWVDYQDTINIYIHPSYSKNELRETIAHEYNHAVWYRYHGGHQQTLFESMIVEGLAEHFREQVVGGKIAPWSRALNENQCSQTFDSLRANLDDRDLYEQVFFGSEEYKKWTGYSIGYWLVSQYINTQKKIDWNKLMKMDETDWKKYFKIKRESN